MKPTRIILAVCLALALAVGCGDDGPGDPGPDADTGQPAPPPETPDPDPISTNCGALNMDRDRNLPGLVDPFEPDADYYGRDPGHVEMQRFKGSPLGGSPVTPEHMTLLTETIRNAEIALGETPDHTDDTQLATPLALALVQNAMPMNLATACEKSDALGLAFKSSGSPGDPGYFALRATVGAATSYVPIEGLHQGSVITDVAVDVEHPGSVVGDLTVTLLELKNTQLVASFVLAAIGSVNPTAGYETFSSAISAPDGYAVGDGQLYVELKLAGWAGAFFHVGGVKITGDLARTLP
jgi:hypothetical protein